MDTTTSLGPALRSTKTSSPGRLRDLFSYGTRIAGLRPHRNRSKSVNYPARNIGYQHFKLRSKPCTKPFSVEKYTTTANHRRMRQSTYLSSVDLPVAIRSFLQQPACSTLTTQQLRMRFTSPTSPAPPTLIPWPRDRFQCWLSIPHYYRRPWGNDESLDPMSAILRLFHVCGLLHQRLRRWLHSFAALGTPFHPGNTTSPSPSPVMSMRTSPFFVCCGDVVTVMATHHCLSVISGHYGLLRHGGLALTVDISVCAPSDSSSSFISFILHIQYPCI